MRSLVDSVVLEIKSASPELVLELRIGELPPATGNAELLRQVWTNLLDNAVKYSRRKANVIIEVTGEHASGEVRYSVKDHGAGFDPKYAKKLFGVFQRLHRDSEFEGTGVGLALVQRIVAQHGGRVWAEGVLDEGATFGFALPARRRRGEGAVKTRGWWRDQARRTRLPT
jgi:light-regulated signal transduction histidine kinase (bacteriophytochrome)